MAKQLYFPAYFNDWKAVSKAVTPKQGWKLFLACLDYAENQSLPDMEDKVVMALFTMLAGGIDRSKAAAEEKARKLKYNRYLGICKKNDSTPLSYDKWITNVDKSEELTTIVNNCDNPIESKSNHNRIESDHNHNLIESESDDMADKPPRASRFTPPTVEEVEAYCRERENLVNPQRFVDFYASKGWKVGNQAMKDWKAAVRTWEQNDRALSAKSSNVFFDIAREEGLMQ